MICFWKLERAERESLAAAAAAAAAATVDYRLSYILVAKRGVLGLNVMLLGIYRVQLPNT